MPGDRSVSRSAERSGPQAATRSPPDRAAQLLDLPWATFTINVTGCS